MIFCSLYSGSSGNSIFVSSNKCKVLIDAGLSGKSIEQALKQINEDAKDIDAILVTHEHIDHIKGIGVLSRRYDIPIYSNEATWNNMINSIGKIKEKNIRIINNTTSIKDLDITAFNIPHDAVGPCGYSIYHGKKKVCVATDLGYFSDDVKNNIKDGDIVLLESNHDVEMLKFGPYPYSLKKRILSNVGHLSNEDCGKAILDIIGKKPQKIILGHLSKTNNYPELAYQTVLSILRKQNVDINNDVSIALAKRDLPSNYINF